jgi:hypothetical protein
LPQYGGFCPIFPAFRPLCTRMAYYTSLVSLRSAVFSVVASAAIAAVSSCSTLHESDLGANRGYNEFGASGYKPSFAGTKGKAAAAAASAKPLAKSSKRQAQYSPMVERTGTGVRVVQDFTTQARGKTAKANAAQVRAARTQQNTRISKNYNNENLLER